MQECLNNIKSVKQLDRSNKGTNKLITGPGISLKGVDFDPSKNFRDQIFGFIFCSSSIKTDLMIKELQEFNKQNERKLWTNTIINYNEFLIEYIGEHGGKRHLMQDTMKSEQIILTDSSLNPHIFALFVSILNNFLNMAHIARPSLFSYCKLDEILHYEFPLSEK